MKNLTSIGILAAASLAVGARAQVNATWSNPAGGAWTTAANWSGGIVPNAANASAIIDLPGTFAITSSNSTINLQSLTLNAPGAALNLTGGSFTAATASLLLGSMSLSGITASGSGGTWTVSPSATLSVSGTSTLLNLRINGVLNATGSLNWDASSSITRIRPGNSFTCFPQNGVLDTLCDLDDPAMAQLVGFSRLTSISATSVLRIKKQAFANSMTLSGAFISTPLINQGLIEIDGGSGSSMTIRNCVLSNTGTIRVTSGTFSFANMGSATPSLGRIELGNAGVLNIGVNTSLAGLSQLTRSGGTIIYSGSGTLGLDGTTRSGTLLGGPIRFAGGTLSNGTWAPGPGDLLIDGTMTLRSFRLLSEVTVDDNITLVVASGSLVSRVNINTTRTNGLQLDPDLGPITPLVDSEYVFFGSVAGTRTITSVNPNSTWTITPTGTVRIDPTLAAGSVATIQPKTNNQGLIANDAAGTTLTINNLVANSGTLRVSAGTLKTGIPASGDLGVVTVAPGAQLQLLSGTLTSPLSVAGPVVFAGANVSTTLTSQTRIQIGGNTGNATLIAPRIDFIGITNTGSLQIVSDSFPVAPISATGLLRLSTITPFNNATSLTGGGITIDTAAAVFVNSGSLTLTAGRLTLPAGTTSIRNTGTIQIAANDPISTPIDNRGTVRVTSGTSTYPGVPGGVIRVEGAAATLVLPQTAAGTNAILTSGVMALSGTHSLAGRSLTLNAGTLRIDGVLQIASGLGNFTRQASATVEVAGELDLQSTSFNLAAFNGAVTLNGGRIRDGAMAISSPGSLTLTSSPSNRFENVTVTGNVVIGSGNRLQIVGAVGMSSLTVNSAGVLMFANDALFGGNAVLNANARVEPAGAGRLRIGPGANVTVGGTGIVTIGGPDLQATLQNSGSISTTAAGQSLSIFATVQNDGVISAAPGSTILIRRLLGGTGSIVLSPTASADISGSLVTPFAVPAGSTATFAGSMVGSGSATVSGSLVLAGLTRLEGTSISGPGNVDAVGPVLTLAGGASITSPLRIASGPLGTTVVVNGLASAGTVTSATPGVGRVSLSTGARFSAARLDGVRIAMNARSALTLTDSSADAAGDPAFTSVLAALAVVGTPGESDVRIDLRNNDVILRGGGLLSVADIRRMLRQFIDTSGIAGIGSSRDEGLAVAFATAGELGLSLYNALPVAGADVIFKVTYPGDADFDGEVDAADLAVWQANLGSASAAASTAWGDFDANGQVDEADRLVWVANEGRGVGASLGVVPEPGTMGAAVGLGGAMLARRRRRVR